MISIPTRRLWIAVSSLLLFGSAGALCGYLQGRRIVLRDTRRALAADAAGVDGYLSSMVDESVGLLAAMNASPYVPCSDRELDSFRRLIYHAANLRDAGRIRNGRLLCSAVYGRTGLPATYTRAESSYPNGTSLYINLPPYLIPGVQVFVRRKGDAYVVEDPSFSINFARYKRDHDVLMTHAVNDLHGSQIGFQPRAAGAVFDRNAVGRLGDALYATRCSARNFTCVVSYGSVAAALSAERPELALKASLGGLCGGFAVLAFLVVYWNGRAMGPQLRRAIRNDRLEMVYQPIVDIASGRTVGAEALARWTDEDSLAVSPAIFVKIAEERGFAGELTRLVVRRVLADLGGLMRSRADFRLSINVTASDLGDADFLPMLESALAATRTLPSQLVVELTESSTVDLPVVTETIRKLRARGHAVQLDDFGTGYSSLAYLKDLSVDAIKIDKAFTQAISTHAVIGTILPQMLSLAETLNLQATVEGIETAEQAAFFASLERPVLGQGWFFGRPAPAAELHARLAVEQRQFQAREAMRA